MNSCTCENWTLKDLSLALMDMHKDNKEIVVPMFQRGKRWKKKQEEVFIDSLKKSYPVGTMLFYRSVEGKKEIYTLVDGLQRGNTIRKYMNTPTKYFSKEAVPKNIINDIYTNLNIKKDERQSKMKILEIVTNYVQELNSLSGVQYYPIAYEIASEFNQVNNEILNKLIKILEPFLKDLQADFDKIANTIIPVIVYSGDEDSLQEIFDRINSQGTKLTTYEVYAASWPTKRFKIDNLSIVEKVLKKYDSLSDYDFKVSGYNRDEMRINKELTVFEYVFGLSRYLNDTYDFLHFDCTSADDVINPMGFELINACLNDSNDKIKILYLDLIKIDLNLFEKRLIEIINFVEKIITKITKFKGNNRKNKGILHSKYQIMSMISTTFKEKYDINNLKIEKSTWNQNKKLLEENMIHHYVNDILRKEWNDGGTSKIHKVAKPNKYVTKIPLKIWETTLNAYFEQNNMRKESKNVSNPKKEDIVLLNCIYLPIFTAMDQLSLNTFDIEHIATKEQMKSLIAKSKCDGLPISSIANLCYLPQKVNRSKKDKTFYQDTNYRKYVDLSELEKKYSFTKEEDLEWIEVKYKENDAELLREFYMSFLNKRFKKLKEMFYKSLDITDYCIDDATELVDNIENYFDVSKGMKKNEGEKQQYYSESQYKCIIKIKEKFQANIEKQSRSVYVSDDEKFGIAILMSKKYLQGNKEKYWFAYRTSYLDKMSTCKIKYIAFICGNEDNVIVIPIDYIESIKHKLNYTEKDGKIHWHIVIFKNDDGNFSWQYSIPNLNEIDISKYLL